jgi:inorganic triphosphatase YgiF
VGERKRPFEGLGKVWETKSRNPVTCSMPAEIELKLGVSPAALRALHAAPWLKRLAAGPARHQKLVSVYFDTRERALRGKGLSLRVRRSGDCFIQTVKGPGTLARAEWEEEIKGAQPQRAAAKATPVKPFTKRWDKLKPVFETDVARTAIMVKRGKSRIEVALDRGQVKTGRAHTPIHEVELELKTGDVADLQRLARRVAAATGGELELRSKAARGYALADGALAQPVRAQKIVLADDVSSAEGFRAIAFSCLQHLCANQAAVIAGEPEGVHQMRVGLRRLRAALSLFQELIAGPDLAGIKKDLKWLGSELGPARDYDVFLRKSVVPMKEDGVAEAAALESDLAARRKRGFERARRMAQGPRYRAILLKTALWLTGGHWARADDDLHRGRRARPLAELARDILSARHAKVTGKLKKLKKLDARRRHKLRIAVKKLRYAVGFFGTLYGHAKARTAFTGQLQDLQDALGRLNDIRVHEDFARKARLPPRESFALGRITGQEHAVIPGCIAAADKAGARLRKQEVFWR